jgi:sortase family protein
VRQPNWAALPGALRKPRWAAVAAGVVAVAAVAGVLIFENGPAGGRAPTAAPAAGPPTPSAPAPAEPGFRVLVPSIGADAPVIPEGATGAGGGALTIPSSVHQVAWWDGVWQSPSGTVHEKVAAPGQSGVALLAGHVDSASQGPGVFYRLRQAKPGAAVTVIDAAGKVTHWKVTRIQVVLKSALPAGLFVNKGSPQLALVSCGGPFDAATGHYLDNIIAWTVPA